jgi:hypothetical protein
MQAKVSTFFYLFEIILQAVKSATQDVVLKVQLVQSVSGIVWKWLKNMTNHGETGEYILDKVGYLDGLFKVAKSHSIDSQTGLWSFKDTKTRVFSNKDSPTRSLH